ncbi:YdeI/OmpD-associated family protein [Algoriphagus halophytocola]|uniref:YdeI/OmpD-associated family protein n=1 Tax=Algoriphagus halophytocola TaxID=2991499 RepID=A0ABY6MD43_9BACT|nr:MULTISPECIES: YdeI/OmpD-associated family protein [unclassified Algoriphagus]UZD21615.1 YdeI/OmpD-associated family protein [Algoriphagus sp. TR-M5]WBL42827.1 YdeI/OmpD-associated family protein [Algoriphagus sp. TR-M9]
MLVLAEGSYLLERMPGKGGWTFVKFPKDLIQTSKAFGMMKVSGSIDDFSFEGKHLMPMGNGFVFLPVPKAIRSKIKKEAGDSVSIRLFKEAIPDQIPEELIACLKDDPGKWTLFQNLSNSEQRHWVEYIYYSDKIEVRAERIIKLLQALAEG